jgi:hypothetical protein
VTQGASLYVISQIRIERFTDEGQPNIVYLWLILFRQDFQQ